LVRQDALGLLKSIAEAVTQTLQANNNIFLYLTGQISTPSFRGNRDGWEYLHIGKSWFFHKVVTYTGAANTCDLSFPLSIQLNRIEQVWNDTTTKDFSIRVYGNPSSSAYVQLDTQIGNIHTSEILQLGTEWKYPAGSRLRIYSATNTDTKTDTIEVQAEEL